jgi:hypothetical protein
MASKTDYIIIPGKIMWAKGLAQVDEKYNTYNCSLEITAEEKAKLEGMGCQAKFKAVDNGLFSFKIKKSFFRTEYDKETKEKRIVETSPPEVFLTDPSGADIALDPRTVGNGSDVLAKLEIYDTSQGGRGTRLMKVRVENLIEFVPNTNQEDLPF